jgi:ATP-dependent Clp protease adaptor protein ClpS
LLDWRSADASDDVYGKTVTTLDGIRAAEKGTGTTRPGAAPLAVVEAKPKPQKPSLYRVLILNDDYTPMEFVVYVLERFFNKSREDATRIMLHVHQTGVGVCGVYTYEVAETKVAQVVDMARRHQHPLQCTMEKD